MTILNITLDEILVQCGDKVDINDFVNVDKTTPFVQYVAAHRKQYNKLLSRFKHVGYIYYINTVIQKNSAFTAATMLVTDPTYIDENLLSCIDDIDEFTYIDKLLSSVTNNNTVYSNIHSCIKRCQYMFNTDVGNRILSVACGNKITLNGIYRDIMLQEEGDLKGARETLTKIEQLKTNKVRKSILAMHLIIMLDDNSVLDELFENSNNKLKLLAKWVIPVNFKHFPERFVEFVTNYDIYQYTSRVYAEHVYLSVSMLDLSPIKLEQLFENVDGSDAMLQNFDIRIDEVWAPRSTAQPTLTYSISTDETIVIPTSMYYCNNDAIWGIVVNSTPELDVSSMHELLDIINKGKASKQTTLYHLAIHPNNFWGNYLVKHLQTYLSICTEEQYYKTQSVIRLNATGLNFN